MSIPIRTRTAKLAVTSALALGSAGLLAGPALAEQAYPPPPIEVTVSTPGATIEIRGTGWGKDTEVIITRHRGTNAAASDGGTERTTATVDDDGTFTAPIEISEDAGGTEVQYVVEGVDEQGEERTETRAVNVQLTSAEAQADDADTELAAPATPADDGNGTGLALAIGGAVALAGGAAVARRKVTSNG